jgi:hypothetical protein
MFLCYFSKVLLQKKRRGVMQNLLMKKRRKEKIVEKKIDKCTIYLKQWVLR